MNPSFVALPYSSGTLYESNNINVFGGMNRARGTHGVLPMASIIESMMGEFKSMDEICDRLQMESEEVIRLANRKGIPKTDIVRDSEWSKS